MRKIKDAAASAATACWLLSPIPALAGGFNLDHQNAAAMGVAFAGAEASPEDSGFAAHNPASLAGLAGAEFSASATGVFPSVRYLDADAVLLGAFPVAGAASGDGVIKNAVVPSLAFGAPLSERLSVGLVVNATFGFTTFFAEDSIVRYQAQESALKVIEATPMVAFAASDRLRVGAGLRIQHMDLSLTSVIDAGGIAAASLIPGFAPGGDDLKAAFDARDVAIGYVVGAQADLSDAIHLGLAYSSRIDHDLEGDAEFDLAASPAAQVLNGAAGLFGADRFSTSFATPATISLGMRAEASDHMRVLASLRRMMWSSLDGVTLTFNDGATPAETVTQNWRDSWLASIGAEFDIAEHTTLRGGFMFDQSPVNAAFASPRIPDGDRFWIAAGIGQQMSDRVNADLSLAYAFFDDREISLDGAAGENLFRGSLDATVETSVVAAALRIRYRF